MFRIRCRSDAGRRARRRDRSKQTTNRTAGGQQVGARSTPGAGQELRVAGAKWY